MRPVIAVFLVLALPVGGCAALPNYEKPQHEQKVERLWKERDDCLLTNTPQFDDRTSDPRKVAQFVAMSCTTQTTKLLEFTIPQPDQKARDAFQGEAVRRAADIVMTFRRVDSSIEQHRQRTQAVPAAAPEPAAGSPTPLHIPRNE
ncbi:hypothetical protein BH10PSE6_BH10PSE6_12880 [soil metagenome]